MKLVDALEIANAPEAGNPFRVLLACGFTPLHLQTALKAHLRLLLPDRTVILQAGTYGDIAGTLENAGDGPDAVVVCLEWSDVDPRLGWRGMGRVDESLLSDGDARLRRLNAAIDALAQRTPVALSLPALPMAPVFYTATSELHVIQARLSEMTYRFAAETAATVVHPAALPPVKHDLRTELLNGCPHPFAYLDVLAERLVRAVLPPPPKKGLITDLDETLWSGVLGDDGPDGINWDLDRKTHFHALYQELLNQLADAGTLIGVASKNDEELVRKALKRRDLVVKPSVLFPIEAHWNSKTESIARTLETWNIGPDSVVFVDDNPLEIAQVKTAFPAIDCVTFRKDDPAFLLELRDRFGKRTVREEDRLRGASIRQAQEIRRAASGAAVLDDLLKGARARITFRWVRQSGDQRALELVNKTNQFNLNGQRFAEAEWHAMVSDPATHLITAEYEDRFGKLGKIAVLSGSEEENGLRLKVWVMSCRAFSRRIEHQCLKLLLGRWSTVNLSFTPTDRNEPLRKFLAEIGAESGQVEASTFERRCPPLFHETEIVSD